MDRPVTLSMSQTFKEFASSDEQDHEEKILDAASREAERSEDILAQGDF